MTTYLTRRHLCLGTLAFGLMGCAGSEQAAIRNHQDLRWQEYFDDIAAPAIMIDTTNRRLYFWSAGAATYAEFPIGVARNDELLRRGRTRVQRKKVGPGWTPTPSMRQKYPDLPRHIPPGPESPMGSHALYLGWQYYAIHGTNDPASVGYRTTSGCFRLFNSNIKWLYDRAPVSTRVLVI